METCSPAPPESRQPEMPLPVKIVNAIGWTYVVLAVLGLIGIMVETSDVLVSICGLFPVSLAVGMLCSLKRGRRAWFVVPNAVLLTLVDGSCWLASEDVDGLLPLAVVLLLLLVAPIVLLSLPSARRWCDEKTCGAKSSNGCLIGVFLGVVVFLALFAWPWTMPSDVNGARANAMSLRGMSLAVANAQNNYDREAGAKWVDPSGCTNSTQYVELLFEHSGTNMNYKNVWCVAVNPPADDSFPLFVTANVNPRELLCPQDADRPLKLTCPKEWGGGCFNFCEKAAVIVRVSGASQVVNLKYATPRIIFRGGIPSPGPDTYFLTPTGRVDLVERQAQAGTVPQAGDSPCQRER